MRWWNNILTKNLRWIKKIIKIVRTLLNVGSVTMVPVIFHNPKNKDSHLIMQEQSKFNLKINVVPNGLEKYYILRICYILPITSYVLLTAFNFFIR